MIYENMGLFNVVGDDGDGVGKDVGGSRWAGRVGGCLQMAGEY